MVSTLFGGLGLACGGIKSSSPDAGDGDGDADAEFVIGGTVSGLSGARMVLQLNGGDDLTVDADGSFAFPSAVADGEAYEITIASSATCPERTCAVSNGSGTVSGADVTDVAIDCSDPVMRLASFNWGDQTLKFVDDFTSLGDGDTADPRVVTGVDNRQIDGLAIDPVRDIAYLATGTKVLVFDNASTISGAANPDRTLAIANVTSLFSVEIDAATDRLYIGDNSGAQVFILADASTRDGAIVADQTLSVPPSVQTIELDRVSDRLFVAADYATQVSIFDNASALTSGAKADRSFSWSAGKTGFNGPPLLTIDGCTDRLYLGSNFDSPQSNDLVVFENGSTISGAVDLDADSDAQVTFASNCIVGTLAEDGKLYCWTDSATEVRVFDHPESWSGAMGEVAADRTVLGAVSSSYGLEVQPLQ